PGEIDFNFRIQVEDKEGYVLKISRSDENGHYLDFQQKIFRHIAQKDKTLVAPKVINDTSGKAISEITDHHGNLRKVRLLTWISGRIWSKVNPQLNVLRYRLGQHCGRLTQALQGFDHKEAHRVFVWDIAQSLWTKEHTALLQGAEFEIITHFQSRFAAGKASYDILRKAVIHNDANDNNIIVSPDLTDPKVITTIDYGDAVHSQVINDLAVACAYAIMGHNDPLEAALPLVQGYHKAFPLQEVELEHLYTAIAMRLVISVTKSAINKITEPDNAYLLISEKPAWEVLKKWYALSADFVHFAFRHACGYSAHPHREKFDTWASKHQFNLSQLFPGIGKDAVYPLDLSVSSTWLGHSKDFDDLDFFQFKIDRLQKEHPDAILAGGYLEPRCVYTTTAYEKMGNHGRESRTIHLGVDFWLPPYTGIHALLNGEVVTAVHDAGEKEYGGLLILKHQVHDFKFYTLYGHNTEESTTKHKKGDTIKKGEKIGELGPYPENGNWVPHLHFQIMLTLLDYENDFPGVTYYRQRRVWQGLCPNPNALFKLNTLPAYQTAVNEELIRYRKRHLGKSLSLQYTVPLQLVRGDGPYLLDQYGRKYLDTINNVAHVGHEHPKVVEAGQRQMALLNTNSRYLHDNINVLAQMLLETLPPELSVLHFVNSGSEANELALRMVWAKTGQRDIIASEMGYHGNSNGCIDISSYKFDGKGGNRAPEHTQIFPLPDAYRGKHRGRKSGRAYAEEVKKCIETIHTKGRGVGALIVEPIISCGGQIELPEGFLAQAYAYVRDAGGLCISDEVQVGCGRMGKTFWGFQLHNVIPDIITIGKPLGNGHPLAAVACTQEVANAFANGMEYFNTFGGNPVSCAIGQAVLQTVKDEGLQQNALDVGKYLKKDLEKLGREFPIIGDVRGQGLFLGFELVDKAMNPLKEQAHYLVNRMKDHSILMSTDGPDYNVLKIKPPMVFTKDNARELVFYLRKILTEDFMQV
ncbi:MAG: aminotransferase class III-fold pyridoxal phosphate-dependent enzyme, partial [Bacteroidota bacterium]